MAKETFENKMLNGMYETTKPRMQFLIDNRALTLSVVKYIARHTRFVATRCVDNEKHWQVLYNFSDFLELKKLHEQIEEQKKAGQEDGLSEKQAKFEQIKKKFDVSNNEFVLRAKRDSAEWHEFLEYVYLLEGTKQNVEPTQQTNNLTNVIKKWLQPQNTTSQNLVGLIEETHLTYMSDNGLTGFKVEVVDGEGVKASITDKKLYVGKLLIEKQNLTSQNLLQLLTQVLNASELTVITTKLGDPLKTLNPIMQAISYERAISIIKAIRQNKLISNSEQLNNLLTLNSANIILGVQTEITDKWFLELASKLEPTILSKIEQEQIVEEYYAPHLQKIQSAVTLAELNAKKQAQKIK